MKTITTLIVTAGLLASAAPASAGIAIGNPPATTKSICAFPDVCIVYNGHAGLGSNQIVTDNKDPDAMARRAVNGGGEPTVESG